VRPMVCRYADVINGALLIVGILFIADSASALVNHAGGDLNNLALPGQSLKSALQRLSNTTRANVTSAGAAGDDFR
jgi:hypothetical protein